MQEVLQLSAELQLGSSPHHPEDTESLMCHQEGVARSVDEEEKRVFG